MHTIIWQITKEMEEVQGTVETELVLKYFITQENTPHNHLDSQLKL